MSCEAPSLDWLSRLRGGRQKAVDEIDRSVALGLRFLWGADLHCLLQIPDAPPLLHIQGRPPVAERPRVAVVGSRRATASSRRVAYRLGRELGGFGLDVVSGLAQGIDTAALEGCLGAGGRPCAVLGNGLPRIYPSENTSLARRIAAGGGCVLSEFPLDAPPRRYHFPLRNRLISGLSLGVVVVEAAARSGSLITVRWALEQGRDVLAFPGPSEGPSHEGCHQLIREGAPLVTSATDVVFALAGPYERSPRPAARRVLQAIADGADTIEGAVRQTGLPPEVVLRAWGDAVASFERRR